MLSACARDSWCTPWPKAASTAAPKSSLVSAWQGSSHVHPGRGGARPPSTTSTGRHMAPASCAMPLPPFRGHVPPTRPRAPGCDYNDSSTVARAAADLLALLAGRHPVPPTILLAAARLAPPSCWQTSDPRVGRATSPCRASSCPLASRRPPGWAAATAGQAPRRSSPQVRALAAREAGSTVGVEIGRAAPCRARASAGAAGALRSCPCRTTSTAAVHLKCRQAHQQAAAATGLLQSTVRGTPSAAPHPIQRRDAPLVSRHPC